MTTQEFVRTGNSILYQIPRSPDDKGWCGYLLYQAGGSIDMISIQDSFEKYRGHYIFSLTAPALSTAEEVDRFVESMAGWLWFVGEGERSCSWLLHPDDPRQIATWHEYAFTFSSPSTSGARKWALSSNFTPSLIKGSRLNVPTESEIKLSPSGLRVESKGAEISWTGDPLYMPTVDPSGVGIPFLGPYSGCLTVKGTIRLTRTLPHFQAGLRYAHPSPDVATATTQLYPVTDTGKEAYRKPRSYAASFDPLDPFNECPSTVTSVDGYLRTLFALVPESTDGFPSFLRTPPGKVVDLIPLGGVDAHEQPVAHAAGVVFERSDPTGKDATAAYLTFCGDWGMEVEAEPPGSGQDLLCGTYGLERIPFRTYTTDSDVVFDRLRLVPGQPAFAPRFPLPKTSLEHPSSSAPPLSNELRTAYATVVSGDDTAIEYHAQPESDPLYAKPRTGSYAGVLDFLDVGLPLPTTPGFAMPLIPTAGVGFDKAAPGFPAEELGPFESQVLAVARKAAIRPAALEALRAAIRTAAAADTKPTSTMATTPQGFLVTLNGARYETVTMARTGQLDFAFQQPDAELISLLQTNQLFAVIASPTHLGTFGADGAPARFQNTVEISGWTMTANVGRASTASDYRNVLIFKFCDGPLRDRVGNPDMWSDPEDFSVLPGETDRTTARTGLSQWLSGFIEQAQREAKSGNELYGEFSRMAADPNWKGLLVLRADVSPAGLPDQLRGLAAGVDLEQFYAHHFGVTVTPVKAPDGTIEISGPSSTFGLIDYQHPQLRASVTNGASADLPLPLPVDGPYGFTVLQLQALFRNSVLTEFRSRVQLTANELFGSRVLATYGATGREPANAAVLKGTYQNQGSAPTYVIESSAPTVFTLDSNVLPAVGFGRIQFNTLTPEAEATSEVHSRLQVWGSLAFAELTEAKGGAFDLLSFGTAPQDSMPRPSADGLSFSGLHFDLISPAATPNAVICTFDPSGLTFNFSTSKPRDEGLFSTFALQLDSFHMGSDKRRPRDLGYLPVTLDAPADELKGPWYGISYKVTMGTPGALVAHADFTSRLLIAWSPQSKSGDPTYSAFAGLQLPGAAPGAKLLSLEGVLKLSIGRLELFRQPVADSTTKKTFVLKLANIGLSVLGLAKLPPGIAVNFFLFGDPAGKGALGWYAAYVKKG